MYYIEYGDYKGEYNLTAEDEHPSCIYCIVWGRINNKENIDYHNRWYMIYISWNGHNFYDRLDEFKRGLYDKYCVQEKIFRHGLDRGEKAHCLKKFRSEEKMIAEICLYLLERKNPNSKIPNA